MEEFTWCEMLRITDIYGMFSGGLGVLLEFSKGSPIAGHVLFSLRKSTAKLSGHPLFSY